MEYRTLGKTGIRVSEIGLGCWAIGGASFRGGQPTGWAGAETAAKVAQLDFLREEADSLAEAALRFTLAPPAVSAVIPGAKTPAQVIQNGKASGRPLSEEALRRIRTLFGKS